MRFGTVTIALGLALSAFIGPAGAADAAMEEQDTVSIWEQDRATIFNASEVSLDDFKWIARPILIFADTPADPAYQRQIGLLTQRLDELLVRDVVLIVDTDPDAKSDIRRALRPRGFMLTIVGKDGGVKLRKPFPWDVREITRSIDKMPLRKQEIRERRDID